MTTALALFDVADIAPAAGCSRCGTSRPATTRAHAAPNLLGVSPAYLAPTRYRDLAPIKSPLYCTDCAWYLADAWWGPWFACPTGACDLWARTLADPRPDLACGRHNHNETSVVWLSTEGAP